MMENQFIPYEQALELKVLGFDKPCFDSYYKEHPEYDDNIILWKYGYDIFGREEYRWNILCNAPLYQQAFDWIREKFNLHSWIKPCKVWNSTNKDTEARFDVMIMEFNATNNERLVAYSTTFQEAQLERLKKLIYIIKTKNTLNIN